MGYTDPCSLPTTTITISPRTFLVAAATDALAPFLVAESNGTVKFGPFYAPHNLLELFFFALPFLWLRLDFSKAWTLQEGIWCDVMLGTMHTDYNEDTEELFT